MDELKVSETTVPGVLESLKRGEWLVPRFQREFVWTTEQVSALVQSVLDARPIGMVTLWEQPPEGQLELERVSIADRDPNPGARQVRYFGPAPAAVKRHAVLDGRQRCTAIAMAFGGFRALHGLFRYSGRYFLDVKEVDARKRVKYFKETDVEREGLSTDSAAFARGLFPLASSNDNEAVLAQWMRYLQAIQNPENYPGHALPDATELAKRNRVLQDAFEGIVKTKMAVYTVPDKYSLSDICEIFETLNTTGTKVSTVDLIHSWLYSDTAGDPQGPILLRDWIADLGERDGAVGWADGKDRPELLAQIVTATYIALSANSRPKQRLIRGSSQGASSLKAGDLLSTPTEHWRAVQANSETLAAYLGDAQRAVAGGFFPWERAPYPVSLSIRVALHWRRKFENIDAWSVDELDALFRAFFWRNALSRRYDQGFLSQIGTDLHSLLSLLDARPGFVSSSAWASDASAKLNQLIEFSIPSRDDLVTWLRDGDMSGALQKAMLLPMYAGVKGDIVNRSISLEYPRGKNVELHHIFPKAWCRSNKTSALVVYLDENEAGRDYVNSAANLMPMSRESNNAWKQKIPGQFLLENQLDYTSLEATLKPIFIDQHAFALLQRGAESIPEFWDYRAGLIADDLLGRTRVIL